MELITIALLIMAYFVTKNKSIINPVGMYVWIWVPILILSSMGTMNMKIPSQYAYFIIFLGTLFFIVGYFSPALHFNAKKVNCYVINYKLLIVFEVAAILVLLPQTITSIGLLLNGYKLGHIHTIVTSSDFSVFYTNRTQDIFYYLFVYPTMLTGCMLASYDMWFGKKNKLLQICTILMVAMRTVQYGGRAPVFNLVFAYVIGGLLRVYSQKNFIKDVIDNEKLSRRIKKMIPILALGVVGMIYSVLSRLANGLAGVLSMLNEYFAACPIILSEKLVQIGRESFYTGGLFTVFGFYQYANKIFETVFNLIGIDVQLPLYNILYEKAIFIEKGVDIGNGVANAFVTPFYYFYEDGWFFGIVILSFIWGNICKRVYINYIKEVSVKNFYFLLFFLYSICFSMEGSWLRSPQMALPLIFFFVFTKKYSE